MSPRPAAAPQVEPAAEGLDADLQRHTHGDLRSSPSSDFLREGAVSRSFAALEAGTRAWWNVETEVPKRLHCTVHCTSTAEP